MGSVRREIVIDRPAAEVWSAIRDIGNVHTALAPGFVVDTRLGDGFREVTFANGVTVTETIVDLDDDAMRLAYSAQGGVSSHHHAVMRVIPDGSASRLVWVTDMLPHSAATPIAAMVDKGCAAMISHLG